MATVGWQGCSAADQQRGDQLDLADGSKVDGCGWLDLDGGFAQAATGDRIGGFGLDDPGETERC